LLVRLSTLLFLLFASAAEARVFDYKQVGLAAYIRGNGGLSNVKQKAFSGSSGVDSEIDGESNFSYGGELGAQIAFGPSVNMRIGAEMIQHRPVSEAKGLNGSGQERFTMESSVFIFNPNVTFEYAYQTAGNTKFYFGLGGGLADITVENRYEMTAQGTTDLGVGSFNEKLQGNATSFHINGGLETLFVDNTTFSIDAGYRYLPVKEFKYKGDTSNIVSPGGVAKGDVAKDHNGANRELDLGGFYMGFTFKFYLNFM
jgi:hypothetical protein